MRRGALRKFPVNPQLIFQWHPFPGLAVAFLMQPPWQGAAAVQQRTTWWIGATLFDQWGGR